MADHNFRLHFFVFWGFVLSLMTMTVAAVEKRTFHGDKLFRLFPTTQKQRDFLAKLRYEDDGLDFWSPVTTTARQVDIRVQKNAIQRFSRLMNVTGISHAVTVTDVQKLFDQVDAENVRVARSANDIVGRYASYYEMVSWLQSMCAEYQSLATCTSYGKSYEQRELIYIKIGKAPVGRKNAVFIEGGIHGREWIASASTIYVVNRLLTTYDKDEAVRQLLDTKNIYVVLLTNPDGYEYSRTVDRTWRKTRSASNIPTCFGADPNRNWDSFWATVDSSFSPCSDHFHGMAVFSEPETKLISELMLSKKEELFAYFAIHCHGLKWLVPFGYVAGGVKPDDYAELLQIGQIGIDAMIPVHNSKWIVGNSADIMYPCAGASDDWAKIKADIKYSYTIELRPGSGTFQGFVIPASEIIPSGEELFAGLMASIKAMSP